MTKLKSSESEGMVEMTKKFVVTLITTDIVAVDGMNNRVWEDTSSKVVTGTDAESVARARLAEEASQRKAEHEKRAEVDKSIGPWEEDFSYVLEQEEHIVDMLTERHDYWNVLVFTLDGVQIGLSSST